MTMILFYNIRDAINIVWKWVEVKIKKREYNIREWNVEQTTAQGEWEDENNFIVAALSISEFWTNDELEENNKRDKPDQTGLSYIFELEKVWEYLYTTQR